MMSSIGGAIGGLFQGIGTMVESSNEARTVEGCGKQPSCLFGSSCEEKKRVFNECVQRNQDLQQEATRTQAAIAEKKLQNQKMAYIIGGIILIIVAIAVVKALKK